MKYTLLFFVMINMQVCISQTVTDYDGNVYNTITIGTQVWLQQNIKTCHYRNGDLIPNVTSGTSWYNLTSGGRCYFNNDSSVYSAVYGALYNFYAAADVRGICPAGYHLPTEQEWTDLIDYLGGHNTAGGKMKETGTTYWMTPNAGADNLSGFSALGTGYRYYQGNFDYFRQHSYWCSSTSYNSDTVWGGRLNYNDATAMTVPLNKKQAFFVRCIRDYPAGINETDNRNFKIFPNPAKEYVTITSDIRTDFKVEILDATGKKIHKVQCMKLEGNKVNVSLQGLKSGLYIIRLTSNEAIKHFTIVVE